MLRVKESGAGNDRATDTEIVLDYTTRTAKYTDRVQTDNSAEIPLPDGDPVDLISALVQTRNWNLKQFLNLYQNPICSRHLLLTILW